jgi:hypothetical protein
MKTLLRIMLLLISAPIYGQNIYEFDHILEYKNKIDSTKLISNPIYFVNSVDNKYHILTYKLDKLNSMFNFFVSDGIKRPQIRESVNTNELFETKLINIECGSIYFKSEYYYKYKVKDYYFENLKDTVIDNTTHYHYVIKSNKSLKYQKRKNIHEIHYLADKNSPFFMPFFNNPTVYEEWKTNKKFVPNGMIKVIYHTNWENKIVNKF